MQQILERRFCVVLIVEEFTSEKVRKLFEKVVVGWRKLW